MIPSFFFIPYKNPIFSDVQLNAHLTSDFFPFLGIRSSESSPARNLSHAIGGGGGEDQSLDVIDMRTTPAEFPEAHKMLRRPCTSPSSAFTIYGDQPQIGFDASSNSL
ncbi:hypothetical protein CCHR01_12734 [Colletotrichum chrysophilum]|uniref:Uncharacterized protein n=1 Tax=Colletotrichum chrysophilum TaxID=1836956 RepID=A0AAD9AFM8_9PEZI|nr:hypothetical protein CCHR01_12734 [Colletotrichum chrysophilum]